MPRIQILLHGAGWSHLSLRKLRPDYSTGQIHRWRLRIGPFEIRGWRSFIAPSVI